MLQSFTLSASPQQNGIAEHRIGLVMEVARTSMIHAAAPHFLWPFAVRYAAHQLNLWPRVSLPETSPTLRWTGEVGDASVFRDVTFDESVPFYRLFPYRTAPLPPPPLFLAPGPPPVDPLPPQGPAPSGVSQVDPLPLAEPFEVTSDTSSLAEGGDAAANDAAPPRCSPRLENPPGFPPRPSSPPLQPVSVNSGAAGDGAARGAESGGAELVVAEPRGAEPGGAESGGAEPEGAEPGDAETRGVKSEAGQSLSHHSSCASGLLGAPAFGVALLELEALPLEALALEALMLEALELEVLELEGQELEALELEALELEALELEALELELEALELEVLELEVLELEALELEALELETLKLEALKLEALELQALELVLLVLEALELEALELVLLVLEALELEVLVLEAITLLVRAASPTVKRLLATVVTDPSFESTAASALVAELVDFAAACRLDYATSLVAGSESVCPPSVGGECALGTDVFEDRQNDFECLAATVPHLVAMLLAPEGDPDALDIPTLRSYAEAITGPYSSQWQTAMDAEMASWKSIGTYVDAVPPPWANIVDGMWIFRVKRPPGSPPVFKARYVARGFSQRQGVDFFQTFSPTPKMTTLWVLLHVAAQRDYELHSLDFSTAFLQGSLHKEIWLRRPPGFTGSFPAGTQWSLRRPVYGLRQAPREWHDTLRTTLAALGFAPSTADPSLFLRIDTSLPPFYILVYVDDLVFATADTEALALVKSELQKRYTCTDLGELRSYLGLQITRDRARRTITLTQSHMVQQVLLRFGF
ncbi:unnamed protein product [Closterium sp. Yama58-4]|nr:unnamed protein product [Closterium sp. Yama58-4]